MGNQKITVRLKDGKINIDMAGYVGDTCHVDMKKLETIIGGKEVSGRNKPERVLNTAVASVTYE